MQFSFPNKVSAHPQFPSFKTTVQDDGPRKTGFDSLTSTGFMTISSAEALKSDHRQCSSITQKKSTPPEKQSGTHFGAVTTYSPYSIHRHHDVRISPVDNHKISVTTATPHQSSSIASAGHNVIGSTVSPQPLGIRVPAISPVPTVPNFASFIAGTPDLRNGYRPSGAPTQLTIFYNGSVCVYNDVSPEKAQAIMLLAGNGHSATPNNTVTAIPVEAPAPRPPVVEGSVENRSHNTSPRPVFVAARPAAKSSGGSTGAADVTAMRSMGTLTSPCNTAKPSKTVISPGSVSTAMIPSAVPQARKASLARFLEKRKERVRSTSPYASISGSESRSFSMNSLGSCPLPASQ